MTPPRTPHHSLNGASPKPPDHPDATPTGRDSPPSDRLRQARSELDIRLNTIVGLFTQRIDVLVTTVWDQPAGTPPGWYTPGTAFATINGDAALSGVDPNDVDPTTPQGRLTHPVLIGILVHEAGGHANHSTWRAHVPDSTSPLILYAAALLDEPRVEAVHLGRRPTDRLYLRAASRALLLGSSEIGSQASTTPWEAASAAALTCGRVDAGVLGAADVAPLEEHLRGLLGGELDDLRALWRQALATADDDTATMLDLARQWCAVVGLDPGNDDHGMLGPSCALDAVHSGDTQASDLSPDPEEGEGGEEEALEPGRDSGVLRGLLELVAAGVADEAASEAMERRDRDVAPLPHPGRLAARDAEVADREDAAAAARVVFSGVALASGWRASAGRSKSSPVTGERAPTLAEQVAANRVGAALRRARFRARTIHTVPSATPPGRLDGRAAMLGAAQRHLGLPVTAQPYRRRCSLQQEEPPTRIGIVVDVSGSMEHITDPMSSAAWIMARAAWRVGGRTATIAFGDRATPIIRPGSLPQRVTLFGADQGTLAFIPAIQAADGALGLATGTGARLLVIASDGELPDHDREPGRRLIRRLVDAGAVVLWLDFDGRTLALDGAIRVPLDTADGPSVASVIGGAVAEALARA